TNGALPRSASFTATSSGNLPLPAIKATRRLSADGGVVSILSAVIAIIAAVEGGHGEVALAAAGHEFDHVGDGLGVGKGRARRFEILRNRPVAVEDRPVGLAQREQFA